MKTLYGRIILTIIVSLILLACLLLAYQTLPRVRITQEQVSIIPTGDHPANNRQYNASVWMGVFDNQLYVYPHRNEGSKITEYQNWLCRFHNGNLQKIYHLHDSSRSNDRIFAMLDDSVIYLHFADSNQRDLGSIHGFNLRTNTDTILYSNPGDKYGRSQFETAFFSEGDLYCPLPLEQNASPSFLRVHYGTAEEITTEIKGYSLGNAEYFIPEEGFPGNPSTVMCREGNVLHEIQLGDGNSRALIPTDYGLLIHNDGGKDLLYIINSSGEVKLLFRVECLYSVSAMTVHDSDVFLSLKRYQEWGPMNIGFVRAEKDEAEGTYRLSLLDGTVTKISDSIYDGLFVFDNTGIYACDEMCCIFKLDYDGHVLSELLVVK